MSIELYLIRNNGEVIAISEYKKHIGEYIRQNLQLDTTNTSIELITKKKKFNRYIIEYENLILEEIDDIIITKEEADTIGDFMGEEMSRVFETIKDLKVIVQNYDIKNNKKDSIVETLDILNKLMKPRKLMRAIGTARLLYDIRNNNNARIHREYFEDGFMIERL